MKPLRNFDSAMFDSILARQRGVNTCTLSRRANRPYTIVEIVANAGHILGCLLYTSGIDLRRSVFALAARNDWPILSMKNTDLTLEDVFLRLTSDLYADQGSEHSSEILDGKEGA